jgi:hypothetical protein
MASVRIFTYSEIITAPVAASSGRFSSDSVGLLKQRYLGRETISISTGSASSSSANTSDNSSVKLVQVQADPGTVVHYEIFPENWSGAITEATTDSPFMSGTQLFNFGKGWTISFREASF